MGFQKADEHFSIALLNVDGKKIVSPWLLGKVMGVIGDLPQYVYDSFKDRGSRDLNFHQMWDTQVILGKRIFYNMVNALFRCYDEDADFFPQFEDEVFKKGLGPDYTLDSLYRFFYFLVTEVGPQVVPFVRIVVTNVLIWYRKAIELQYKKYKQEKLRTGVMRPFKVGKKGITQDDLNFLNSLRDSKKLVYVHVFDKYTHSIDEWWQSLYVEAKRDDRYACTESPEKDVVVGRRSKQKWNSFKLFNKFPYSNMNMCRCYGCVRAWCIALSAVTHYYNGSRTVYDLDNFCW